MGKWILLFSVATLMTYVHADALPVQVKVYDHKQYRGVISLKVDGKDAAMMELKGADRWVQAAEFNYEPAQKLSAAGTFKGDSSWWKPPQTGAHEYITLDLGELLRHLDRTEVPFVQRWRSFLKAKESFEAKHKRVLEEEGKLYLVQSDPSTKGEIKAAESRLGFALPKTYIELIENFGPVTLNDHTFTAAKEIDVAYQQMIVNWGTPAEELKKLEPEFEEFFKNSVILYTFSGDGYGALLYLPRPLKNYQSGYYYVEQEFGLEPEYIAEAQPGFENALHWVLFSAFLESYESGDPSIFFVDSSRTRPHSYILEPNSQEEGLYFELRVDTERL